MSATHRITLPGTTFEALVDAREVDVHKLVIRLFRTRGGRMTKLADGRLVPNATTEDLFPVVETLWKGKP